MTSWLPKSDQLSRPVYKSLQNEIIHAIDRGDLQPGARLPTHRDLAYGLNVSVQTVTRAYEALRDLGYLSGEVGRGTFVRERPTETPMPFLPTRESELIDLSMLKPVITEMHHEVLQNSLQRLSANLTPNLTQSFRPECAFQKHSMIACRWLQRRNIPARPAEILFTNGASPALTAAVMTAVPPGAALCVEEISFHNLKPLASYLGIRLCVAEMDEEGLTPDSFEAVCDEHKVRAVMLCPTVANPRSSVMSVRRRREIIRIAEKHEVYIIEDDVMGATVRNAPLTFKALKPDLTFYITSFSKQIMPGLRVGILLAPEEMSVAARNRHLVTNWMADALTVEVVCGWLADGTADKLVEFQAKALAKRHKLVRKVLSDIDFYAHDNSTHVWVPLPDGWDEAEFISRARSENVAVAGSKPFVMTQSASGGELAHDNAIRIAVGAGDEDRLKRALTSLGRLIKSRAEKPLPTF